MELRLPQGTLDTERVTRRLHLDDAVCAYVSGSMVEGLGNAESDLDVYVICQRPPGRSTMHWGSAAVDLGEIDGVRVDVEYWELSRAEGLIDRVNGFELVPESFPDILTIQEVEFIHRLLVGAAIWGQDAFSALREGVRRDRFRAILVTKYLKMCDGMFQDTTGCLAAGDVETAAYNARLAMERALDAYLASRGETNPAAKWRYRKLRALDGPGGPLAARFLELSFSGPRPGGDFTRYAGECLEFANELSDLAQEEGHPRPGGGGP